jgi:hypothetical protein
MSDYVCVHCNRAYTKEATLVAHMCEQKRRALQRDEKRVQAGYFAYNRFYKLTQNAKKEKTYEEFCKSPYYNAFVKFGSFINNINPLYPDKFMDFVIKSGVKLDHWCRDELYNTYLSEMIKVEPADAAIQRSLNTMMEWGEEQGANFAHYFNYVNINRAVSHIANGLISPWILLNTKSGKDLLDKFNDEQLNIVADKIDPPYWIKRFKTYPSEIALVKEICKETGIV